jgi:RNA ligase (TIGR02306 family)
MSTLIVEVCAVEEIKPHPMADRVELVRVKNWWCVSGIGSFKVGDKCVYFPPDSVLSKEWTEKFGITKYCGEMPKNPDGTRPPFMRIRAARFRGQPSFGTIQYPEDSSWEVGSSVIDYYGVTKYEPPVKIQSGEADTPVSNFHGYTDIENIGNYPGVFDDGEEVTFEEKIHGSNCRVGKVEIDGVFQYACGSNNIRRKEFNEKGGRSLYWMPLTDKVKELLDFLCADKYNIVMFGEIYGTGVQDLTYGMTGTGFRGFDIAVNGRYLDYDTKIEMFKQFDIEYAPCLYRGPFSMEVLAQHTDGPTTLAEPDKIGTKFKGREGVVIRPVVERYSEKIPNFGRVILKSISVDYLERKGGTEFH